MIEPFIVRDLGDGWWAARCRFCREWLTKHDFTREEAAEFAREANHRCETGEKA